MFKNAVALVTGGASGLGKATVERFVKNGTRVILCDLETSDGANIAKSLGNQVVFVPTDVTNEEQVANAVAAAKTNFGQLSVAVNCAGTVRSFATYNFNKNKAHVLDDFKNILNVNTAGTFNVIRTVAGLMAENEPDEDGQRGVIVNTAGTAAFDGQIGQASSAASFAGIVGMTLPIARDFSTAGIRVVTISPGIFDTPVISYVPEEVKEFLGSMSPLPARFGKPEEFAHLVDRVIENRLLNGVNIRLDGGLRLVM